MQKHVNLVDLVKSFPTNIFLQNLASIQKRTNPIKFAHLAEKSEKGSISNLPTKVQGGLRGGRAGEGPPGVRDRQRPRPQLHELRSFITQNVETSRLNFELPLTEILNELLFKTQNMSAEPRFAEFLQNFEFSAKFSKIS